MPFFRGTASRKRRQSSRTGRRRRSYDPITASRRRTTELAALRRKIEHRFFEKKVSPGRPFNEFINEWDLLLQKLHNTPFRSNLSHRIMKKNEKLWSSRQTIEIQIKIDEHHITQDR